MDLFKGTDHPKMRIQSLFTHQHANGNPVDRGYEQGNK